MKKISRVAGLFAFAAVLSMSACSSSPSKSPDVTQNVKTSLEQSGFKDISVDQDRDKGVVTLGGHVNTEADRTQAESIAKAGALGQVVSNQIAVVPPSAPKEAEAVNSDLDKGIDKNVDAVLIRNKLNKDVKHDVKNAVVTLTGEVNSMSRRTQAEKAVSEVPNVRQVVNELQIKNQKASTSN